MIHFEWYKGYGIEYSMGEAVVQNYGFSIACFDGGYIKSIKQAKEFIDKRVVLEERLTNGLL